jgi:ankyrin repeat protein
MKRREFLQKGLALGATALLPNVGLPANAGILSSSVEPLMPIWEAAVGGHWSIVKEWLRRDPSLINVSGKVRIHDWMYKLPLFHLASVLNADVGILKYLVSLGADVNAKAKSELDRTALHIAAKHDSSVEVLQCLISQGADINAKDRFGMTPLNLCVYFFYSNVDVLRYLISQGADVHVGVHSRDYKGDNAVELVAMHDPNVEEKRRILREAMARQ